jgi:Subtilase family
MTPDEALSDAEWFRQIRVVAERRSGGGAAAVRGVVDATLGQAWLVERLVRRGSSFLVRRVGDAVAGTAEHAAASHEAALALEETGEFTRVEADVPIRGYAAEEGPVDVGVSLGGDSGEEVPLYWVHETLRWRAALEAMPEAVRGGVGVSIGQPDTGYTVHPNLGLAGLDLTQDWDVIDDDDNALDPMDPSLLWPVPTPGHGTATASVVAGHGDPAVGIVGLTPAAELVPFRAVESVVQMFDSDVARAVARAREAGCHVITMSLGGKGFFGLRDEIQRAVDAGIIVMAAAGNYVRFVTAPASYDNCIAVAATGPGDVRWWGSSRGRAVDVSMPGAQVPVAQWSRDREPFVGAQSGTSFAVAALAAAAGLWLAMHGRDTLIATYGPARLQHAFLATLRWPGVCVVPPDWDTAWGIGRVDLPSLLAAPLPAPADLEAVAAFRGPSENAVGRIAAALDADPVVVRTRLAALLRASDPSDLADLLRRHEGELVYLGYTDPAFASAVSSLAGSAPLQAETPGVAGVSGQLATRLGATQQR